MTHILPNSATPFEIAIDESVAPDGRVGPSIPEIRYLKLVTRPGSIMPFLVYEYGLEQLRRYVPNLYDLIDQGRQWERFRGTHKAIHDGLDFIGYGGTLYDPPARRIAWADFQIQLDRLRDSEADLLNIDGVTELSSPVRSNLRRVFFGHDIPAAEGSYTIHGECIWGDDSGALIENSDVKWSFGRTHNLTGVLDEATLTAFGEWLPAVTSDYWVDANVLWVDSEYEWADLAERSRRSTILNGMAAKKFWVRFNDENGALIGYRKAQALQVRSFGDGMFEFNGVKYSRSLDDPTHLLIYAHTGFGDGDTHTATEVSVFGGTVADEPGKLWRQDVDTGINFSPLPVTIPFGKTVRDKVQILLELT